nr:hypothetical protein [Tanacetum cinerariifolium]
MDGIGARPFTMPRKTSGITICLENGKFLEMPNSTPKKGIDWNKPPKEGDGAWHIRIESIDPDGEKCNKNFQSILTTRKLSEKENPSKLGIIGLHKLVLLHQLSVAA